MDLYMDPTGDLDLTGGVLRLVNTEQEASTQKVTISLRTYRGEYFYDITAGIPYLTNVNNKVGVLGPVTEATIRFLDTVIKDDILSKEGVISIKNYKSVLDKVTGEFNVAFIAETEYGDIVVVN